MTHMQGFDTKFSDFPDYILTVTKEIWEDRNIASLHTYYSPDIIVRSPAGIVQGNEHVIAATMATLAEFPDRQLLGEDVIWSGTPECGMLSSHRIISTATHNQSGVYGKASYRTLHYRILADCHAIANQINDEWLIRDQGAIVRQLGIEPKDYARQIIDNEGGIAQAMKPLCPQNDVQGPYTGKGNTNQWGQQLADILTRVMQAEFSVINQSYDRAANLFYPGGVDAFGYQGADSFWMGLRASLPSAQFTIHHCIGREDKHIPPRAAIRWSLDGKHSGWGNFGAPSQAQLHIMGITHAEFSPYGIRREYTLFDETAIWKQILLAIG